MSNREIERENERKKERERERERWQPYAHSGVSYYDQTNIFKTD